jgi:hypothetical protein
MPTCCFIVVLPGLNMKPKNKLAHRTTHQPKLTSYLLPTPSSQAEAPADNSLDRDPMICAARWPHLGKIEPWIMLFSPLSKRSHHEQTKLTLKKHTRLHTLSVSLMCQQLSIRFINLLASVVGASISGGWVHPLQKSHLFFYTSVIHILAGHTDIFGSNHKQVHTVSSFLPPSSISS